MSLLTHYLYRPFARFVRVRSMGFWCALHGFCVPVTRAKSRRWRILVTHRYVVGVKITYFKFTFNGSNYRYERNARFENLMKIADKGIVLPMTEFASVMGYHPVVFEKMLQESKWTGWLDEYSQMLLNVNTANSSDKENGRPAMDDTEISDSAEISRDNE